MNIHEYQAKAYLKAKGIRVPEGIMAKSAEQAQEAARQLPGDVFVVKAQVHAGGRGKAGGVKVAHSPKQAGELAEAMLGSRLITKQTGAEGEVIEAVLIEQGLDIKKEFYFGITLDREQGRHVLIASAHGGMDIEQVAATVPGGILRQTVDPYLGVKAYQAGELGERLGLTQEQNRDFTKLVLGLYDAYTAWDCSLLEINPLALLADGSFCVLDAKMNLDDNALFRHGDLEEMREGQEDPRELEAARAGLSYVSLDGDIGCMVNGAGLAMATMDVVQQFGGKPANFLDIGGGADAARVEKAFRLILADQNVRGILINVFGGITGCDAVAEGVVGAMKNMNLDLPVVVRIEGSRQEQGREIFEKSGLKLYQADTMSEAAQIVIRLAKGA